MATQYKGHSSMQENKMSVENSKKSTRKSKDEKVMTVGLFSLTLLIGIIAFAICFVLGIFLGPNLPI